MKQLIIHCPIIGQLDIRCKIIEQLNINCPTIGQLDMRCPTIRQLNMHCPIIGQLDIHCPTIGQLDTHCRTLGQLNMQCPIIPQLDIHCPPIGQLNINCPIIGQLNIQFKFRFPIIRHLALSKLWVFWGILPYFQKLNRPTEGILSNSAAICAIHFSDPWSGNIILQRIRNNRMVLWKGKLTDQGLRHVWQRQSRARAERDSWFCLNWLSWTKNWPLSCRESPEQREIPGLGWEHILGLVRKQDLIEMHLFFTFQGEFYLKKNKNWR